MPTMPTNPNPLPPRPSGDAWPDGIDQSDDLMSRYTRVLNSRKRSFPDQRVAVADPAGLDLDSHRSIGWLWNLALDDFKGCIRAWNLHDAHL